MKNFSICDIVIAICLICFSGCEAQSECIDEGKKHNGSCPAIIDPVCGCNRKTYNNSCEAGKDGVTSYVKGKC